VLPRYMDAELHHKILRFEEWLRVGGVSKPDNLKIAYFSGTGLGLKYEPLPASKGSTKNDDDFDLLEVTVPYALIFCPYLHPQKMRPLFEKVTTRFPDFFKYRCHQGTHLVSQNDSCFVIDSELAFTYLAFLVEHKNPHSFWKPYFDLLPTHFDSTLFWNEEELAIIRGTNLYTSTKESEKLLHYLYANLLEIEPSLTFEQVKFAHGLFSSRSYGVKPLPDVWLHENVPLDILIPSSELHPSEDEQMPTVMSSECSLSCLVPFCDFFNHDLRTKVYFAAENDNSHFCIQVHYNPKLTGTQVFSNYGPKSNEELLLYYGFLVDNNVHNTYWISIPIMKSDPNKQQKLAILKKLNIAGRQHLTINEIPQSLFQGMRVAVMSAEELYFYDVEANRNNVDDIISVRNEREMWRTLISKLSSLLENINDTADVILSLYFLN
jgi:hypothetical protein